jgi:hypothetical protein
MRLLNNQATLMNMHPLHNIHADFISVYIAYYFLTPTYTYVSSRHPNMGVAVCMGAECRQFSSRLMSWYPKSLRRVSSDAEKIGRKNRGC